MDAENTPPRRKKALTRREFLAAGSLALAARVRAAGSDRIGTPYKLGKYVLNASGTQGSFDAISVDGPFIFRHKGRYYMTFIGFDGIGYQTGLASSSDLVNWQKEGCILKRDPTSPILKYNAAMSWILRENGLYSPGELKQVDGYYLGAYHAYPGQGYEQGPAVIGLGRSRDLRNWVLDPPCLLAQDGADWERGGLYKPCLLHHHGKYYMFYNAKNQMKRGWHEQTGVAISKDLKSWTRYSGNPVIANGVAGSLDERFASDPCVLQDGKEWVLYYYGLDANAVARDLAATSPDLLHITKSNRILIDVGPEGSIDSRYAHKPSVIQYQGDLYHYYCAVHREDRHEIRGVSVARSRPWKSY
jgi:predicted GH43/DUF377 family glycosyl hydrolase